MTQKTTCMRVPVNIQSASDECLYWSVSSAGNQVVACNRKSACCDEKFVLRLYHDWTPDTTQEQDQEQRPPGDVACAIERSENRILTCSPEDGVRLIGQTDLRGYESLHLASAGKQRGGSPVFCFKSCRSGAFLKNHAQVCCSKDGNTTKCNLILACNQNAPAVRDSSLPKRRSKDYKYRIQIQSNVEVSVMSTLGTLLEPESAAKSGRSSVACRKKSDSASRFKWTFSFHGEDMYTISTVLLSGRKPVEHILFYDDQTGDLKLSSSPMHSFPNRHALFKVRPETVQVGKETTLCFTISHRVGRKEHLLSCKADGKLALVKKKSRRAGSAIGKSEMFFVFESWRKDTEKAASQKHSPASLEQLASRAVAIACGGGMEGGLLANGTKEKQSELQFKSLFESFPTWISECILGQSIYGDLALESDVQCCKCCGERYERMDPKHNPKHWRYLEVQIRRMNGGAADGRNVSPQAFLKACGVFASFITAANMLRR